MTDKKGTSSDGLPIVFPRAQHNISRNDIDRDALKIMYRLLRHGFKAYLVGGGVRDLLLGKKPKDFDVSTDATPNQIRSLFRNCRVIGRRFRLCHIFFGGGKIVEVSTFRDVSDPMGKDPEAEEVSIQQQILRDNRYGSAQTDAHRRDITINGLFYDLSTFSVLDYVGGMTDLQAGIVRVIGDPNTRFNEDPIRLVRVIRHAARAGFQIEESCQSSILRNGELILKSSQVRLFEEIKKDLCSSARLKILRLLREFGLLKYFLPEISGSEGELLSERSALSASLARADEITHQGHEISPTVIFSLLAVFVISQKLTVPELREAFSEMKSFPEKFQHSFSHLALPKKERQRIEDLILFWTRVLGTPKDRLKSGSLGRNRYLQDLIWLMRCLGQDQSEAEHFAVLLKAQRPRHSQQDTSVERRSSRRRRRYRPPRRDVLPVRRRTG